MDTAILSVVISTYKHLWLTLLKWDMDLIL